MPSAPPTSRVRVGIAAAGTVLCIAVILVMTLSPTPLDRGYESAIDELLWALHRHGLPTWFGYRKLEFSANVAMFVPLGLLIALALPRRLVWLTLLIVPVLSGGIEWAQAALLVERTPSLVDVLANTIGGYLGALAAWMLRALVRARDERVIAAAFARHGLSAAAQGGDAWRAS